MGKIHNDVPIETIRITSAPFFASYSPPPLLRTLEGAKGDDGGILGSLCANKDYFLGRCYSHLKSATISLLYESH